MKIAIYQMNGVVDYKVNLKKINKAAQKAKEAEAKVLFLPECFYSLSNGRVRTNYLPDTSKKNIHYENIQNIANENAIAIIGGSAATVTNDNLLVNRAYNFDKLGNDLGHYDKQMLFACKLNKNGVVNEIKESNIYEKGTMPKIVNVYDLKIGLGICFDLRFPNLSWDYKKKGTNILTYASAFTVPTGIAHWEILLRARAIETQQFVVAAAQVGVNNDSITTYGHSMVIDPWGKILLNLKEKEDLGFVNIDLSLIKEVQNTIILD